MEGNKKSRLICSNGILIFLITLISPPSRLSASMKMMMMYLNEIHFLRLFQTVNIRTFFETT